MIGIEELAKLSDDEIRSFVNKLIAPITITNEIIHPGETELLKAQFYINELDRRERRRIDAERDRLDTKRRRIDLGLELLIVVLIGFELFVGVREGEKQFKAMDNLEKSSAATANTMIELKRTMDSMNGGIQAQLELNYDMAIEFSWNEKNSWVVITNRGRTNVYFCGAKSGDAKAYLFPKCHMITPSGSDYADVDSALAHRHIPTPTDPQSVISFRAFLKSENGTAFVADTRLSINTVSGGISAGVEPATIRRGGWPSRN